MAEKEDQGPTRRELAQALAESRALIESQGAALAALQSQVAASQVAAQKPSAAAPAQELTLRPYVGLVKALVPCCYDHKYEAGELFHVSLPALWTDDPFEAVIVVREDDNGKPVTEKNPSAPTPIDFRFRKAVSTIEDPTPRIASEYN